MSNNPFTELKELLVELTNDSNSDIRSKFYLKQKIARCVDDWKRRWFETYFQQHTISSDETAFGSNDSSYKEHVTRDVLSGLGKLVAQNEATIKEDNLYDSDYKRITASIRVMRKNPLQEVDAYTKLTCAYDGTPTNLDYNSDTGTLMVGPATDWKLLADDFVKPSENTSAHTSLHKSVTDQQTDIYKAFQINADDFTVLKNVPRIPIAPAPLTFGDATIALVMGIKVNNSFKNLPITSNKATDGVGETNKKPTASLECECGKTKHGFASHANWCPIKHEDNA